MVVNSKKCHLMRIGRGGKNDIFTFKDVCYKNSKEDFVLEITIDKKLNFKINIRKMCKKSGQKLIAVSKISAFLNKDKKGSYLMP